MCATVVLDQRPDFLQQYLANAVYEAARAGNLRLPSFPDFSAYIQGLRETKADTDTHQYQVCVKRGDSLVALGAFANKWLQSENFQGDAKLILDAHNKEFNPDGDFVEEPEERRILWWQNRFGLVLLPSPCLHTQKKNLPTHHGHQINDINDVYELTSKI